MRGEVKSSEDEFWRNTQGVLKRWNMFRWVFMAILLGYAAIMLERYFRTCEEDYAARDKIEFVHEMLLGRKGVMLYVFVLFMITRWLKRMTRRKTYTFLLGTINK